jgi:hypothetical protein
VRIFPTTPAPTGTAGAGLSPSKSSGDLFGQHLAGASQSASAHPAIDAAAQGGCAHPSPGDAESTQTSDAQASAQTPSKDSQPGSVQSASVPGSSNPVSSPRLLPPQAVLVALGQPAAEFIPAAASLKTRGDPKAPPSQAGKSVKDGEASSLQKAESGQPAIAGNQHSAATGPVPVLVSPALMSIVADGSIRGDRAQRAAAVPDVANLAAEANANSWKQDPQHATTVEGSPATESSADAGRQLSNACPVQLSQESFALPAIASSIPMSSPSAPSTGGISAAQSGSASQKGSADLQLGTNAGSTMSGLTSGPTSGQKTGNSTSSATPAYNSATPSAQSGASSAQQGNTFHLAVLQAGGVTANGPLPQAPMLHVLTQDGGSPHSSLEAAAAAPRAIDSHGDALEHLAEAAGRAIGTGIDSARLIQTMDQTVMQVGMRSADFGDISIRASLAQQQMMAQISVNHDELSQAMMAHLSTVQAKIGSDYGLQASVSVHHQGTATAGQGGGQSYQQQQHPNTRSSRATNLVQPSVPEAMARPMPAATADAGSRLDIQA